MEFGEIFLKYDISAQEYKKKVPQQAPVRLSVQLNRNIRINAIWLRNTTARFTFLETVNVRFVNSQTWAAPIFKNVPPSVGNSGLFTLFPVQTE